MDILGSTFNPKFTKFEEFRDSVERIANPIASSDKKDMQNENKSLNSEFNISIDESHQIYLNLNTGEKIRSILYIDSQISSDLYFSENQTNSENLHRYHLYKCPTVEDIFAKDLRFNLVNRDDNYFKYSFFAKSGELLYETNNQHLLICKSCLTEFNITNNSNYTNLDFYPTIFLQRNN